MAPQQPSQYQQPRNMMGGDYRYLYAPRGNAGATTLPNTSGADLIDQLSRARGGPSFMRQGKFDNRKTGGGYLSQNIAPTGMAQQPAYTQQPSYAPQSYMPEAMPQQQSPEFPQGGMMDNRAINRELQARRSAGRVASQPAPNLYNPGADTQAVSAVFGNEIGLGGNSPYLLHQMNDGSFAYNRGKLDPTLVNLTGDYSKWIT